MLLVAVLAQAATAPQPIAFDLRKPSPDKIACSAEQPGEDEEVVVCGRRRDSDKYRVDDGSDPEAGVPKADFRLIGPTRGKIQTEQVDVGGFPSNRIMVRIAIPF